MTGGGEKQSVVMTEINDKFIGFEIELFNYTHDQGLSWCHGEVIGIQDGNKKTVKVRWTEEYVGEGGQPETIQKLPDTEWNNSRKGAWREYLME